MAETTGSDAERLIMAQMLVAFGQGTGAVRVSRAACKVLYEKYEPMITEKNMAASWDTDAVQVLERVRAIGRLAAHKMAGDGRTAVSDEDVSTAIPPVQAASVTTICDGGGG